MSYAQIEAARFIGACYVVGAVLGVVIALRRGERRAQDRHAR